jgi:hypothetical protein
VKTAEQTGWNYRQLLLALVIGFLLQFFLADWLHVKGDTEFKFGLGFDVFILLRMTIAYFRKESGRGWIFYAVLCYTSIVWIDIIIYLVVGKGWA